MVKRKPKSKSGTTTEAPDTAMYAVPSIRSQNIWTPSLIRSAMITADSGSFRLAADLVDWILTDDRIRGALDSRIGALFGLPLSFEATSGDGRRRKKALRELDAEDDWWEMFPEDETTVALYWAIMLGFVFGQLEVVTLEDHGNRNIPRLQSWPCKATRYDTRTRAWVALLDAGQEAPITAGDGHWFGLAPYGKQRPWALGLWKGCSRWCLLKANAIDDWGRHGENASKGVASSPETSKKEQRQELANDLYECVRDGQIVLPPGFEYKLVEATANTRQIYQAQIEAADLGNTIAIKGNNLTTKVDGGSLAAAIEHKNVDYRLLRRDAQGFSTAAHDQVLNWWARWNYGDSKLAPWPLYPTEQPEDLKAKADMMGLLATAVSAWRALGYEEDAEQIVGTFQIPFLERKTKPVLGLPPPAKAGTPVSNAGPLTET